VSSAMMGLAGFVSIHSLTPMAVFFVIVGVIMVGMVGKLLQYLKQPPAAPLHYPNREINQGKLN